MSESLAIHSTASSKALIHSKRYVMTHAVEIILTLSTTFIGSADQQSVDVKTDFTFLGHDNLFSKIYITTLARRTDAGNCTRSVDRFHSLSV